MSLFIDWFEEEYNKGTPEENHTGLVSEYSSRAEGGDTILDLVSGEDFTISGTPAETLSRGFTEGGHAIRFGAGTLGVADMEATAHPFLLAQDHTFEAWIRVEGGSDQTIWTNQGSAATIQKLEYDSATESLVYTCVVGATSRSVSFAIESNRLTHVVLTREYSGGDTALRIYLDGGIKAQEVNTGAPVVTATYDDLTIGSNGSAEYFYGVIQGIRLYDDVVYSADVLALHTAGQTRIENGAYATQTITPTTATTPVTGRAYMEEMGGGTDADYEYSYPVVLYKRDVSDNFRAMYVGGYDGTTWAQSWGEIDEVVDSVYDIRFQNKTLSRERPAGYSGETGETHFDILAGGEASPTSIISSVDVAEEKRQILEKIVMRNKPLHTWAGMVVRYV